MVGQARADRLASRAAHTLPSAAKCSVCRKIFNVDPNAKDPLACPDCYPEVENGASS